MKRKLLKFSAYAGLQLLLSAGFKNACAQSYTYNLNNTTFVGGAFISPSSNGFTGTLTSVSVNTMLNASVSLTYADDIMVYVDYAPFSTGGILQVGSNWNSYSA